MRSSSREDVPRCRFSSSDASKPARNDIEVVVSERPICPSEIDWDSGLSALLFQGCMQHRASSGQLRDKLKAFLGAVGMTVK